MSPTSWLCFIGDDFTGSTDALELLTLGGLRTSLFTYVPSVQDIAGLDAFGIATDLRSESADQIEHVLKDLLPRVAALPVRLIHYKVCSTFDSSPDIGSIGRAIDVAFDQLKPRYIPVMPGAPSLGRYCVFGNLFARYGSDGSVYRLDRHPSVSQHPITPMTEADLVKHLAKQTRRPIELIDVRFLFSPPAISPGHIALFDTLTHQDLHAMGLILDRPKEARFIVGSSGVESSLLTRWSFSAKPLSYKPSIGPRLVMCGSCSPVSIGQTCFALQSGFKEVVLTERAHEDVIHLLRCGQDVVLHTNPSVNRTDAREVSRLMAESALRVLENVKISRLVIAGGDTSGAIARHLRIASLRMVAPLVRGAPVVMASAPGSPADGLELVFKGGQVGSKDFFIRAFQGETRS
ncbi:MAG: hypothetical protein KatS3mg104_0742 [Phycisphaerae bacterium]|jgi:uncharacterized protein YgbK (DUF1537 family)|nr:MAG: hypothetical protein KatS3mg104_0742 [Phycisphaerae bacterium]